MTDTKSGFSDDERAAMKQRADELRATKGLKGAAKLARELEACVKAIDALGGEEKTIAARLHTIVSEEAPDLDPKTFYGFPAYAKDGKVLVFYQPASQVRHPLRHGVIRRPGEPRRRRDVAGVLRRDRDDSEGGEADPRAGAQGSELSARRSPVSRVRNGETGLRISAEDGGFEPPRACTQHAFQACAIGH